MALRLPDHAHCESCGDPVQFGKQFCSDACEAEAKKASAKEKKMEYVLYAVTAVLAIVGLATIYHFLS